MTVVIVATVRKKCTKQKGKDDCNDEEHNAEQKEDHARPFLGARYAALRFTVKEAARIAQQAVDTDDAATGSAGGIACPLIVCVWCAAHRASGAMGARLGDGREVAGLPVVALYRQRFERRPEVVTAHPSRAGRAGGV